MLHRTEEYPDNFFARGSQALQFHADLSLAVERRKYDVSGRLNVLLCGLPREFFDEGEAALSTLNTPYERPALDG